VIAGASDQLWWYVARSGGIVSWALLTASVLFGLAISTKATSQLPAWRAAGTTVKVRPNWLLDLHRFIGGLATVFVGVHVLGIVADSYVHFGPTDVLVPLAGAWHPEAVALGIVAMYLLVAVELTSLLRNRLRRHPRTKRIWRLTHALSFPLFLLATWHGITAGTDAATPWLRWVMIAAAGAVTVMMLFRIRQARYPTAVPTRLPTRAVTAHDTKVNAT